MTRDVLLSILDRAEGISTKDARFEVADGHHLSLYVGQPGQAMVLSDIVAGELADGFVMVRTREARTTTYLSYDAVHGVSTRPPKEEEKRRAGFT